MHSGFEIFRLSVARTPDHLALVDDRSGRRLSYAGLLEEVEAVASGFATRGIGSGTAVMIALPPVWEHCITLLALMRLNAVPALMNFRMKPEEIAALCRACNVKAAVIGADDILAARLVEALPAGAAIWSVGGTTDRSIEFTECRGPGRTLDRYHHPEAEAPAYVFFTSGTTGLPKPVLLPHRATEPRLLWLATQAGLRHGTHNRALCCMPFNHVIGFYGVFLVTLAFNGTCFVVSQFDPQGLVDRIERERVTYCFCVPTMYQAIISAPNYRPDAMRSLQLVLYGGQTIDPGVLAHIDREWGGVVRHIYGTTETMCSLYHPDPVGRHATLRPGYYSRIRLVQPHGGEPGDTVRPGEQGELIVDATVDTVFSEYYGRPEATAEKLRDGWYYTGDVFLQEADGDVTLIGRIDNMIRSGGESISPEEVETVLSACRDVKDVAVTGIPDPRWGNMVVACVVAASGTAAADLADRLDVYCRESALAGYKRPKAYVSVDSLPRNAANKVVRSALRDIAATARRTQAGWLRAPGPAV